MPLTEIGDPRLQALFGANDVRDTGVRPVVRLPRQGLPPLLIAIGALLLAVLLFTVLNSRRTTQPQPSVRSGVQSPSAWPEPPALYMPPMSQPAPLVSTPAETPARKPQVIAPPTPAPATRPAAPAMIYSPAPVPQIAPVPLAAHPQRSTAGAPLVIDTGVGNQAATPPAMAGTVSSLLSSGATTARMRASALANRSTTVPQGTLIPAVLETAFNSTQAGFARAIVSRDVRSFDGANVLIPRGSRLVGEYRSDVAPAQKRAVIIWTRLIRPDGMTIAMDSPAVDTLGRGGVAASVNTHFLQRLGDALLQTTVGIGSAFAQRSVTGPVVVLPGAAGQMGGQLAPTNTYVPTLTVPAGKSISIFVAHDLDFSAVGAER